MKLILVIAGVFLTIIAYTQAFNFPTLEKDKSTNETPPFVKVLKKLHQGPAKATGFANRAQVTTEWITQKLDHFDSTQTETWQMRYMINDEFFKPGGPMFIYVGGEWEINASGITYGIFVDLAKEHNGMLFYTEQRYYGESRPTLDLRLENLKYMSVKQSLADLAHFIEYQRETVDELANSKVIMAGASYAATMVVWFKKLYPQLLNGGWASSAPLMAKVNFLEFMEVTAKAWHLLGGEECYQHIENAFLQYDEMAKNKRGAELKAILKLCNEFDVYNDLDVWTLFSILGMGIFGGLAQYQKDNDISMYCNYFMSFGDDVSALANFLFLAFGLSEGCIDATYKNVLTFHMDTSYANEWARPFFYQACNELGWFHTSDSKNQPFSRNFPLELSMALCRDIFGSLYSQSNIHQLVEATNDVFGGLDPQVENIYMTHGSLDPWSILGHGELEGATILPNASHCQDFDSISPSDSPEMRRSKERLAELVREWLAD
ncbi:putative serine protease K12H4.7 [Stomoxys calcitrans]|uniref:putative serine protease K12H4.7 n=1 Tax=Stomoxys calcitrans TaxID=35570 RepID=UPI0027E29A69|nr:putative serine protease K12H4.7 [Stomoxys calcitrans]